MSLKHDYLHPSTTPTYTMALFWEYSKPEEKETCSYTIKDRDHHGLPSLYRLYMAENDPTEFRFAEKYMLSYDHWLRVCNSYYFKEVVAKWRRDLELKIKAEALTSIMKAAQKDSPIGFAASKFLLEGGWKPKATKGRPSKDQIREAAENLASEKDQIINDIERLGLN